VDEALERLRIRHCPTFYSNGDPPSVPKHAHFWGLKQSPDSPKNLNKFNNLKN